MSDAVLCGAPCPEPEASVRCGLLAGHGGPHYGSDSAMGAPVSWATEVCGKRCAHDSECLLLAGHEPVDRHETQHGCCFYDAGPAKAGAGQIDGRAEGRTADVLAELVALMPAAREAVKARGMVLGYTGEGGRARTLRGIAEQLAHVEAADAGTAWTKGRADGGGAR